MNDNMKQEKKNSTDFLRIYKSGAFFTSYGDDSKILNYFFNYKISFSGTVGFPESSLNKVTNTLERNKISYSILYKDKDPIIVDYKNLNNYKKALTKALLKLDNKDRIDNIINKIYNIEKEETLIKILTAIEEVIINE